MLGMLKFFQNLTLHSYLSSRNLIVDGYYFMTGLSNTFVILDMDTLLLFYQEFS